MLESYGNENYGNLLNGNVFLKLCDKNLYNYS